MSSHGAEQLIVQRVLACEQRLNAIEQAQSSAAPPDLAGLAEDLATAWDAPGVTMRARNCVRGLAFSTHMTAAEPSSSNCTPSRPKELASSTRTGAAKVRPASWEKARNARPWSPLAMNQATATSRPRAAMAGPLMGQASIIQPSA